jgi:hypothetical protein
VTHYANRLRARQAAQDYMGGAKLRCDAEELADKSLAKKFDCNECTIKRVKNHLPVGVLDEEDQKLIRLCALEKEVLDHSVAQLTKEALCHRYQVSREAIDRELDLAGFVNPKAKRKKKKKVATA